MEFKKLLDGVVYGIGMGTIAGVLAILLLYVVFHNIPPEALRDMGMLMAVVIFIVVSFYKYKSETIKVNKLD